MEQWSHHSLGHDMMFPTTFVALDPLTTPLSRKSRKRAHRSWRGLGLESDLVLISTMMTLAFSPVASRKPTCKLHTTLRDESCDRAKALTFTLDAGHSVIKLLPCSRTSQKLCSSSTSCGSLNASPIMAIDSMLIKVKLCSEFFKDDARP